MDPNPYFQDTRPPVVSGMKGFHGGPGWNPAETISLGIEPPTGNPISPAPVYPQQGQVMPAYYWPEMKDTWGRTGEVPPPPPAWGSLPQDVDHEPPSGIRPWVWALAGIAIVLSFCLIGIAGLVSGGEGQPSSGFTSMPVAGPTGSAAPGAAKKAAPSTQKAPAEKAPGIGDKVRVEGLEYQVHAVKCGIKLVGSKDFGATPQGQYCRVELSVANLGRESRFWDADMNVEAEDTKGREFSSDSAAGIHGNRGGAGFLDEINPGNKVRAYVFFDLPQGARVAKLKFTAGLFGDEVQVKV